MKRLLIITLALAFITFSCRSGKDNNIYVNHAKEKEQFKTHSDKKYNTSKKRTKKIKK